MDDAKEELRQKLRAARLAMSAAEVATKSRTIVDKLYDQIDWANIKRVHIYRSVPEWNEVDTTILVEKLHSLWPQIVISQPTLDKNAPPPPEKYDLIIIPVLGFDEQRFRLGLGGGWYDRFLADQPAALKVGLAFQSAMVSTPLPRGVYDIPLDKIITEVV